MLSRFGCVVLFASGCAGAAASSVDVLSVNTSAGDACEQQRYCGHDFWADYDYFFETPGQRVLLCAPGSAPHVSALPEKENIERARLEAEAKWLAIFRDLVVEHYRGPMAIVAENIPAPRGLRVAVHAVRDQRQHAAVCADIEQALLLQQLGDGTKETLVAIAAYAPQWFRESCEGGAPLSCNHVAWRLVTEQDEGELEVALGWAQKGLGICPKPSTLCEVDQHLADTIAAAYTKLGDAEAAEELMRAAIPRSPNNPALEARLAAQSHPWIRRGSFFRSSESGAPELCAVGTLDMKIAQRLGRQAWLQVDNAARAEIAKVFGVWLRGTEFAAGHSLKTTSSVTLTGVMIVDHFPGPPEDSMYALACVQLDKLSGTQILGELDPKQNAELLEHVIELGREQIAQEK